MQTLFLSFPFLCTNLLRILHLNRWLMQVCNLKQSLYGGGFHIFSIFMYGLPYILKYPFYPFNSVASNTDIYRHAAKVHCPFHYFISIFSIFLLLKEKQNKQKTKKYVFNMGIDWKVYLFLCILIPIIYCIYVHMYAY